MTMNFTDVDNVDKRREKNRFALDIAEVVSVPSDAEHTISVRRLGDEGGVIGTPALVASKGDVALPEPGDLVVIGFAIGGQRLVLGVLYENDAPSYKRGVRRIGHDATDSNITITRAGNVEINSDGEVLINGQTHATTEEVDSVQTTLDGHIADTDNPHNTSLEEARTQNNNIYGDIVQEYGTEERALSTMQYDEPRASRLPAGETAATLMTDNEWDQNIHAQSDDSGLLTYKEAQDWAEERGGRLPTLEEVEGLVTKGSGSGYDSQIIWTQTKAGQSSHYVQYGSYVTASGADPNDPSATREIRDDSQTAYVRWVAEEDQTHLKTGSSIYTGSFEVTSTGNITISTPFAPTMIEFHGEAVGGQNVDRGDGSGSIIANYQGSFSGTARSDGHRQVVHSGGSGDSINSTSHYSSTTNCIAIRYAGRDGQLLGRLLGDVSSFNSDGFTVNISEFAQNEVITFTAYR